ncbi:MAG: glycoside hydrolase family 28 protein [Ignavibacteriaceae bacterium]
MNKKIIIFYMISVSLFAQTRNSIFNIKDFGAKGDGITLNTKAIQKAIDKCSEFGGTVLVPAGQYLTGSLELKSNVRIYLSSGSIILGSTNLKDYQEHKPKLESYNDHFLKYSLFYAENAENISFDGEGTIDGQGEAFKVKTKKKPERYENRPFVIRFVECKNISVQNITLKNSAMWMEQYLACKGLTIHGIKVFNHANQNNDMMDIDGCKNVIISDCTGDTDDDGITLKSTSPKSVEDVVITNCIISSHCNAIKIGTESTGDFKNITISNIVVKPSAVKQVIYGSPEGTSGITLTTVDGGNIDGVTISNIRMDGPEVPIFLRLGNRGRKYKGDASSTKVGEFKNVNISNIVADNVKSIGCSITGIPGHYIENISLSNIIINYSGGVNKNDYKDEVPELENNYPEGTMWGNLPSYGFYVRHGENISFSNIELNYEDKDVRPVIVCEDVNGIYISGLKAECDQEAKSFLRFSNVRNGKVYDSESTTGTNLFLNLEGDKNNNIKLSGNDFTNLRRICNGPKGIVMLEGNFQ